MSELFDSRVISKSHLYRSLITFGKIVAGKDKESERDLIIRREVDEYRSSQGGSWNYNDLIESISSIARGLNPESVVAEFSRRQKKGEAVGKVSLLKYILRETKIVGSAQRDVGGRQVDLGDGYFLDIRYDVCFEFEGKIYCLLIFPRGQPPKQSARKAVIKEFSQPFSGMDRPHILVVVDNLNKNGRRSPRHEEAPFEHSTIDEEFRLHLKHSRSLM